jgi:hypothetical protein
MSAGVKLGHLLFEEPGALEQVAKVAGEWFIQHMSNRASNSRAKVVGRR